MEGSFNDEQARLETIHRQARAPSYLAEGASPAGFRSAIFASVRKFSHATHDASDINDLVDHLLSNLHDDMLLLRLQQDAWR